MPIKTSLARARQRIPQRRKIMTTTAKMSSIPASSSPFDRQPSPAEEEIVSRMARQAAVGTQLPTMIPDLFINDPPIKDTLVTPTSKVQDATVEECRPFLAGEEEDMPVNEYGVPHLDRQRHLKFLRKSLGRLPSPFVAADASRPWIFYWCLNGMSLLGADVSGYRNDLVATARHMQNATGGFGGGFGHESHLATTYAMVLALAIVGGESAYEVIDREAMWKWLSILKQPDGGFRMSLGGEVDVRGAYCAAVIITLLQLPLALSPDSPAETTQQSDLFTGLANYVRRCQTFEGGISGKPDAEAHGAYAFCALGCLAILDAPHRSFPRYLDVSRLISWLSSRQYAPEGGFCGRTNKLVDGCYSHWVGGCWPLLEASIFGPSDDTADESDQKQIHDQSHDLYSREGLIRYILSCGQDRSQRGGMRDKPSRPSDAYHTCYVLSGLSSAQHIVRLLPSTGTSDSTRYDVSPYICDRQIFHEEDRVNALDPVYVIPEKKREDIVSYFSSKPGLSTRLWPHTERP
ncbi:terpenoid cyclases/Protein prenyltransferase [Xylariomycetidae sp. FL2044]|nr:terpenoid cyclases/Protein prenyltransferase [Xylariomycetidae sp. FL2044]